MTLVLHAARLPYFIGMTSIDRDVKSGNDRLMLSKPGVVEVLVVGEMMSRLLAM